MKVTWTKTISFDFAEADIIKIVNKLGENSHITDDDIDEEIYEELSTYSDEIYYGATIETYEIIRKEIKKRLGGYQLSMFDDDFEKNT